MATITETTEVDPTGTVQIKIKGEASTRIICLRVEVKATTTANTGCLRVATRILAKGNHRQDYHHHRHPLREAAVEAAHVVIAQAVQGKADTMHVAISWQARQPVAHEPWKIRMTHATTLMTSMTMNTWVQDISDQVSWETSLTRHLRFPTASIEDERVGVRQRMSGNE
jgi:hypothetical protein